MPLPRKDKTPIIVPPSVRRRAGMKPGDSLESKANGGVITITVKTEPADPEYTPQQRKIVDREIAKGLADIRAGRIDGPFESVAEMAKSIEADIRARRIRKGARSRK